VSADNYLVVSKAISDRMGKGDSGSIINGRDIYASTSELINESLVVIGTHT
jgi:hypothetical protein